MSNPVNQTPPSRWKRLICALFHHRDKEWWPIHHSWGFVCNRCGMEGVVDD